MGVNKVIFGDETLIDLTGDTVTPDTLVKGATAHDASGEKITGTYEGVDISAETADYTAKLSAQDLLLQQIRNTLDVRLAVPSTLQNKTVTPSESEQIVKADNGFDGLGTVTVVAIPQSYTNEIYQDGYGIGYNEGHSIGYNSGYTQGLEDAVPVLQSKTITPSGKTQTVTADSGYDGLSEVVVTAVPSVNSITTSGTYDSATYHGDYWGAIDAKGNLLLVVEGGTSTSYEAIKFETGTLPSGVTLVNQSSTTDTSATSGAAYVAIFSGVTYSVNIALNFSGVNGSNDYTTCTVTITKV